MRPNHSTTDLAQRLVELAVVQGGRHVQVHVGEAGPPRDEGRREGRRGAARAAVRRGAWAALAAVLRLGAVVGESGSRAEPARTRALHEERRWMIRTFFFKI